MNVAEVVLNNAQLRPGILALKPDVNLRTGYADLQAAFGQLTSLERDLLTLSSSIFASDLAFKRGEREDIVRHIRIKVPVVNHAMFERVRDDILYAVYLLSHDAWDIEFIPYPGTPEETQTWPQETDTTVLLFSGGLDSFSAAVQLGCSGKKTHLISHLTGNQNISRCQKTLFDHLIASFPNQFSRTSIRVGGVNKSTEGYPFPSDQEREETQRTRSFLFLTLAGIAARRLGAKQVIMIAENGQLAIHLPLTAARISAFSTHTAHPEFVGTMKQILRSILAFNLNIDNPYLYKTKAEVVANITGDSIKMIPNTISCWASARMISGYSHCGECVPCLIRRIGNEKNGIKIDEYSKDVFLNNFVGVDPNDRGKRNFVELAEFIRLFSSNRPQAAIIQSYPELINEFIDLTKAIEMYRRFAVEANQVFSNYPNLNALIK